MDRSSFALPLPLRHPLRIALPRLRRPRRPLLTLALALLTLPVLGGSWLWLRDSSLVAVEHVRVTGAHGPQAHAIDLALEEAATRMSTLHVKLGALRAAVARFPTVRDLKVSAGFPHTLRIQVIGQPPVAALLVGGVRTAVAADGAVLGPAFLSASLPLLHGASGDPLAVGHVGNAATLDALGVLGAAPPTLRGWVARVYDGREGLTVAMRNGLLIYFGDGRSPHAKWLSAARVLADPSSAGAWYVDVRLPQRPAAGISGGVAGTPESTTSTAAQVSASDPTAASLAASLAEAVNGNTGGGSTASAPATSTGTAAPTEAAPSTAAPAGAPTTPAGASATATAAPTGPSEAAPSATTPSTVPSPGG